ncbi:uncharacterized protein LACBIDRAFT_329309 [Laccaria bicolor S238N-H82]|uniref:Predicted protein n=1 Tax=Laccaria bicolor (strain S238N-H82 / ATCC MYA-4686) TaxID=486041 RepID=B0DHM5_LACBS|nr:uncharacterized protein LACBIDRAFT_329309 [Laccaria bicolor S238N-H82]EDR05756.1 predicted protein [Laccaria bicolor S238N-H82]|eukprot:XP_001883432.1 predicted protein [Laccaria bicolor S238N-H82]
MGEIEEGIRKLHANAVLAQDILHYAVLFAEIADAYFEREMHAELKPIYELLIYILLQTAACMKMLEELCEAAEVVYEHIRQADPMHNDVTRRLQVIDSRKSVQKHRRPKERIAMSKANAVRVQSRLTHLQLSSRRPRRKRKKQKVEMEADEDRMVSRLRLDLECDSMSRKVTKGDTQIGKFKVDVFREISFDDWLKLFMQMKSSDISMSQTHIKIVSDRTIRLAIITCGLAAGQHTAVVEQAHKLITVHQFNNEPLRILVACLSSGLRPTDSFITSTLQKHLFNEMKLADTAVKSPEVLNGMHPLHRAGKRRMEDGDDGVPDQGGDQASGATATAGSLNVPDILTKHNSVIVAIYGQICIATKSYQSAIFYLLHAYDYCPDDPMICLCLAIASIGRAMQRQSDNRHHLVTQAMAFLTQYRSLRGRGMQSVREVEYNFSRTFHQLGPSHPPVVHYKNVLELAEKNNVHLPLLPCMINDCIVTGRKQDDLFTKETAYNLSLIFVFTDATHLANALYRRWLST